jgi:hypothetical protein
MTFDMGRLTFDILVEDLEAVLEAVEAVITAHQCLTDHPVCGAKVASPLFLNAAATPPVSACFREGSALTKRRVQMVTPLPVAARSEKGTKGTKGFCAFCAFCGYSFLIVTASGTEQAVHLSGD